MDPPWDPWIFPQIDKTGWLQLAGSRGVHDRALRMSSSRNWQFRWPFWSFDIRISRCLLFIRLLLKKCAKILSAGGMKRIISPLSYPLSIYELYWYMGHVQWSNMLPCCTILGIAIDKPSRVYTHTHEIMSI